MTRIGIDLGGTKIEGIALEDNGDELYRARVDTPSDDYVSILNTIRNLINTIENKVGCMCSVGICTPGAISPATGKLKNSNTVCMNGKSVFEDLETLLDREIRISNDANCFALSEAVDGAAQDASVVFGVIIGTGAGAGVVINKQVLNGPNAIAGEWGHNPLPWPRDEERPGPECYCGKKGCIETFLSGPGISHAYQLQTSKALTAKEIVGLADSGGKEAEAVLSDYEDRLARSLAHVINILDPDVIVLGGGMGNIKRLYKNIPKLWKRYVFSDRVDTGLVAPEFGDSSGVRGAAWLWND